MTKEEFITFCAAGLPNVIARAEAYFFLGGMTSRNALSNADALRAAGERARFRSGKKSSILRGHCLRGVGTRGLWRATGCERCCPQSTKARHSRSMSPRILPADLPLSDEHGARCAYLRVISKLRWRAISCTVRMSTPEMTSQEI